MVSNTCVRTCACFFAVAVAGTPISAIEETFRTLTNRDDIAIILINQHVRTLHNASSHTHTRERESIAFCVSLPRRRIRIDVGRLLRSVRRSRKRFVTC